MSHKYDGGFMQSLTDAVERAFGRWLGKQTSLKSPPSVTAGHSDAVTQEYDYSSEFDQSRHAVSIEHSREVDAGCWEPDEGEPDE